MVADAPSRPYLLPGEWEISPQNWAEVLPSLPGLQVDLMATPYNYKLPTFVLPFLHHLAIAVDARLVDWTKWGKVTSFPQSSTSGNFERVPRRSSVNREVIRGQPYPHGPISEDSIILDPQGSPVSEEPQPESLGLGALILSMDRVSFILSESKKRFGKNAGNLLARARRPSSIRQQQIAWSSLQAWLRRHPRKETDGPLRQTPSIAKLLCELIDEADPGTLPKAHDVRKTTASLAGARGLQPSEIIQRTFWSSSNTFIDKYLICTTRRGNPLNTELDLGIC